MDKDFIKTLLIIVISVCYFATLVFMFLCEPMIMLVVNILLWSLVAVLLLSFRFIDWLNDW